MTTKSDRNQTSVKYIKWQIISIVAQQQVNKLNSPISNMAAVIEKSQYTAEQRTFCALRYLDYKKIESWPMKRVQDEFCLKYPESRCATHQSVIYWVKKLQNHGTLHNQNSKVSPGETHSG